jgi:putative transposase
VSELHDERKFSILKLCKVAGIARSSYYKWLGRGPSKKEIADEELSKIIKEIYEGSNKIFGVERIQLALFREKGMSVNVKRVRRIMRRLKISSIIRRKKETYVKSTAEHTAENIINRDFEAEKPNQKWFTDVTYLKYGNGCKAYLSAILDRHDQSIVAWKISINNDNALVKDTFKSAFNLNPNVHPTIQSDRGSQYTSGMYHELSKKYGFTKSMSRVSKCLDNQPIESFWGTLKAEYYYHHKFNTLEELINGISNYIDFYMNKRYVKKFGGFTPSEARAAVLAA